MTLPLRTRLFFAYSVLVAIALAAATLFAGREDRQWLLGREIDTLVRVGHHVAFDLSRAEAKADRDWTQVAEDAARTLGYRVTLIDADGRVLGDSEVPREQLRHLENHASRPEVRDALAGRPSHDVRRSATTGREFLYVALPAREISGLAVLRLAAPLEEIRKRTASLLSLWLGGAACTLAVALLLFFWMAGRHAARVGGLARVAARIGAGDAAARAPETPPDEVGRLGAAMNEMSRELRARLAALERERDEREQILVHMTDGVALLDASDRVLHANHALATVLGAAFPPHAGTSIHEFARLPELKDLLLDVRQKRQTVEGDLQLWAGPQRLLRATVTCLRDEAAGAVILVLHDLTEEERLNRVRRDFVANVSHELRTPLTSIRGYAETLLDGGLDDTKHREEFVRVIRDAAVRLESVTTDLLSLSDLERPEVRFAKDRFNLREAVEHQVAAFRDSAARAGLVLELEPGAPIPVIADRPRMEQVIANLLDNALKYTDRGRVDVSCGGDDARAWCVVRDTGTGIAEEHRSRIFERFYRVDKARSRDRGGTGLGLAIVKHIVELHGGKVSVESEPGVGSLFRIEIPRGEIP